MQQHLRNASVAGVTGGARSWERSALLALVGSLLVLGGSAAVLAAGDAAGDAAAPELTAPALDAAFNRETRLEFGTQPELPYTVLEKLTIGLPADAGKTGWAQLLANDLAAARGSFEEVLAATPGQGSAVRGLILLNELEGREEESTNLYLARVRATAGSPEALVAIREMAQWRSQPLDAQEKLNALQLELIADPKTDGGVRAILASSMLNDPHSNRLLTGAKADQLLPKSGLIDGYQVTFGPFGLYANELGGDEQVLALLQRPFPPENGLGKLEFSDPVPTPAPAIAPRITQWPRVTIHNPETRYGRLDIDDRMPQYNHSAIFYTVTNLRCAQAGEAIVMLSGVNRAMVYLNGLPIWSPELGRNTAPNLYMLGYRALLRVHLQAGDNPIVIKHDARDTDFSIRVLGSDWQPIAGAACQPLSAEALAAVKVTPLRGQVAAEPVLQYDLAWQLGSKDGRQVRRRLGDLVAAAQQTDVARFPDFCQELLQRRDYLSVLALAESLRTSYPDSLVAQYYEAVLQRLAVQSRLAADGRYGVPARAKLEALAKKYPQVYLLQKSELEIAQERNDPEKTLNLARRLARKFVACPEAHRLLAQLYQKRSWVPETEAEIKTYLGLYAGGNVDDLAGAAGEVGRYAARAPEDAHQFALQFFKSRGRQAEYLNLRVAAQQAGQESVAQCARHLLDQGRAEEGLKLLQDDLAAWPKYERVIGWDLARYQRNLGNWDAYAAALETKLARQPYHSANLQEAVEVAVRRGLTQEALAGIDAYVVRFGGTEELLRLQADLQGVDPLAWYQAWNVGIEAVTPEEYTVEKYQSADVAQLVDLRVLRFSADTSAWEFRKQITVPLVTNAVDHVSRQNLGALKNMLEVKSRNPDGKSYIPEYINGNTAEMYNVDVGTVVSSDQLVFHRADPARPNVQLQDRFRTVEDPQGLHRLVLIVPAELDGKLTFWMNLPDQIKHTRTVDGTTVVHVFENTTHEPLKREANMPGEDLVPGLEVFVEPGDLFHADTLPLAVAPAYPSQLVAATARRIVQDLPAEATQLQQFDAIIAWVKTELKPGQGANTFDDMIAMKAAGDRPSRQELAQALAESIGLPVRDVVQVSTYSPYRDLPPLKQRLVYRPGALLQPRGAGMLVLEDRAGLTHYRSISGQQAELYTSLPAVDARLDGNSAMFSYLMFIGPMGADLRRYEGVRPVADGLRVQLNVQVAADNSARLLGRAFLFGRAAGQIRERRTDARARQIMDNQIVQWFWPQLDDHTQVYLETADADQPMTIGLAGRIGRMGQVDPAAPQEGISIPALAAQGRNSFSALLEYIGKTEREYDYLFEDHSDSTQNFMTPSVLVYEAPAGWAWSHVPEDLMLDTEFGWYYCDYQVLGNRVEIHRGFMVPKQRLTPAQWKRFNAFLGAIRNYETLGKLVCRPLPEPVGFHTQYLSRGALRTDLSW